MNIHTERTFQDIIKASLCKPDGYAEGDRTTFDAERGLFPPSIFRFIQTTQPDTWDALQKAYGPKAEARILERIMETKAKDGTLHLLRQGYSRIQTDIERIWIRGDTRVSSRNGGDGNCCYHRQGSHSRFQRLLS